ncbi:GNAT family N-acetyltransferase [Rhodovulum sp. P5]|uniref:GNAT family N-acetyltransferase n=1 Tax=Rhodovulum sp. P5 TaxID=1564506 RepID=UPI0009DB5A35|nr:GNAT family N-acetyltransferase [Rhodovulum sp. P5]
MGRPRLSGPRRRHLTGLRPVRPGDGPACFAVFHAAVHRGARAAYSAEERAAWAPSTAPPADWEARLLAGTTLIAERFGHVLSFMTLGPDGYLDLAYVAPDVMGQGVGRLLHDRVLDAARSANLSLLSTEASLVARPVFAHLGWRETARQSVIRHGVALTNFRMELSLAAAP